MADITNTSPDGDNHRMSTNDSIHEASDPGSHVPAYGEGATRLDQGHIVGTGGIPAQFQDPGLPPHVHRLADVDERAAKRAERQVATMFLVSIIASILFVVVYFAVPIDRFGTVPILGTLGVQHALLGLTMALSLLLIGLGAVHWAKTLMPDHEVVEERHTLASSDDDRAGFSDVLAGGASAAQLDRRPLLKVAAGGALGLFAIPPVLQLAGSLGPLPHDDLSTTFWSPGKGYWDKSPRLMRDPEMTPIKASDVTIGSVFHVLPEGIDKREDLLNQKVKASVLLMRLNPDDIKSQKEKDWGYQGIVAYSKICTHVGCPVGLYEHTTHHLLCPCHQSTFDVTDDCKVIFGPAGHALPQLKITVDDEGYLVAKEGFKEPVGPSFWERA